MKVLTLGLDETTSAFLLKHGFVPEQGVDIETPEDLHEWTADGLFGAVAVDLNASQLGIYFARTLRDKKNNVPIIGICLPSNDQTWSNMRAMFLENGGDDFIQNPASPRELAASLRAMSRRFKGALLDIVEVEHNGAKLKLIPSVRRVLVNGMEPELTGRESQLLFTLGESVGRAISKEQIMASMYVDGIDDLPEEKIVDVFVCKIRSKLSELHSEAGSMIETVRGQGYRLRLSDDADEQLRA